MLILSALIATPVLAVVTMFDLPEKLDGNCFSSPDVTMSAGIRCVARTARAVASGAASALVPEGLRSRASTTATDITVSSAAELQRALARLGDGSTIKLMAGHYPQITISGISTPGQIVVTSADPAQPAVIGAMVVRNSSGIMFRNLHLAAEGENGRFPFLVMNGDHIAFDRIMFRGPQSAGQRVEDGGAVGGGEILMIRGSRDISITRSDFGESKDGLSFLNVDRLKVGENEFHDLQTDGMRGGGVNNAEIWGNVFTDFYPRQGDHPDGIQLWSTNQKEPGRNIVIHDNLVVRGRGHMTQGIFIRDTYNQLPFENVEIRDNMIVGGLFNGIAISGVTGANITGNDVIAMPDQKSWIRVTNGKGVILSDNRAQLFLVAPGTDAKQSGNRTVSPTNKKLARRINEWLDAKPERRRPDSILLPRILAEAGE